LILKGEFLVGYNQLFGTVFLLLILKGEFLVGYGQLC